MLTTVSTDQDRIPELETARGVLAAWVVVGHALPVAHADRDPNPFTRLLLNNVLAVDVFIVLSGFVIFGLLLSKPPTARSYLLRRFLRLFPVYVVCLLASVWMLAADRRVLVDLLPSPRAAERLVFLDAGHEHLVAHVAAHLTMLHGLLPSSVLPFSDFTLIGQAWSISVEWQFYLLAPLALILWRRGWPGIIGVAGILLGLHLASRYLGLGFVGAHLAYFAIGAMSVVVYRRMRSSGQIDVEAKLLIAGLLLLCTALKTAGLVQITPVLFWLAAFGVISLRVVRRESRDWLAMRLLRHPALVYLGAISYSLYLCHMLVLYRVGAVALSTEVLRSSAPFIVGATLVGSVALAAILHHTVELPLMNAARRWSRSHPAGEPARSA